MAFFWVPIVFYFNCRSEFTLSDFLVNTVERRVNTWTKKADARTIHKEAQTFSIIHRDKSTTVSVHQGNNNLINLGAEMSCQSGAIRGTLFGDHVSLNPWLTRQKVSRHFFYDKLAAKPRLQNLIYHAIQPMARGKRDIFISFPMIFSRVIM